MFKVCFLKICRNQFIDSNVKLRENKTITFYTHQSFYLGFLNIYNKWKESITINRYFYLITMDFRGKWLCHLFQLPLSIVSVDWTNLSNLSLSLSLSLSVSRSPVLSVESNIIHQGTQSDTRAWHNWQSLYSSSN